MELMSGNEAIAQGAWEAGARIGVAYPGTPSTETLEAFAKKDGVYAEWCVNEKVAVEVGIGASVAGARVLSTMKHVGVNVAADPLFTAAYAGVGGGLVVLAADDPGMYSSQNEQDSHWYARAAHIPMLDPADSAEALRFTREAYDVSERFDVPVFIRSTVRVSHTKTPVEPGERTEIALKPYESDPAKWVMMPAFAKPRRKVQLERIDALRAWAEECPYNEVVRKGSAVGVVCAGAVYQHVVEALPDASVFKLGLTWPLPQQALRDFAESVDALYVVEEASEYLDEGVRALGIEVAAFESPLPRDGELTPGLIRAAFGFEEPAHEPLPAGLPGRPPALCAGCPHRLVFKELSRMKAVVTGDIGCYTLGALPPLSAMDTTIDMGASVSMSHGFELAWAGTDHRPVVGVIGDSTFAHSGLSALISTVYNQGRGTVCVLDNRTKPLQRRDAARPPLARARPRGRRARHRRRGRAHRRPERRQSRSPRAQGGCGLGGAFRARVPQPLRADRPASRARLRGDRRLHGMRRVLDFRLSGHREGSGERPRAHRCRPVHRMRPVRPVLRLERHRATRWGERRRRMMTSNDTVTVLLCGVGGQGTILAADLLAHAALESGYDAKVSEIHGMSQRGGAVTTVVRFGRAGVQSMVSDPGCADCVVSFETTEALRNLPNVREGGYLLVADESIQPLPVLIGRASMPEHARETLAAAGATLIPAGDIAVGVGAPKSVNVVLLGALATRLDFSQEAWERVVARRVPPKTVDANLAAFRAGLAFAREAADGEGA